MKKTSLTVIICLAIAIWGIQTGNTALEPVKPCSGDPMRIDFGDIIDCGVNICRITRTPELTVHTLRDTYLSSSFFHLEK